MSASPSPTKLTLLVKQLPANRLSLTNRVYLSPKTLALLTKPCPKTRKSRTSSGTEPLQHPVVSVGKHPYEAEAHPEVQDNEICLNRLQRRSSFIRPGDKVKVAPFKISQSKELDTVTFDISKLSHRCDIREIDTDIIAQRLLHNHKGQFFERGQTIAMDFGGTKLLLNVTGLVITDTNICVKNYRKEPALASGRLLTNTHLSFRMRIEFSSIRCIGTKVRGGFLDVMWTKGAPKELIDLLYDHCFDAIREHKFVTLYGKRGVGTDLLRYALEIMAPPEVVRFIVENYPGVLANPVGVTTTPLHYACSHGSSFEVIQYLLEKYPAALKKRCYNGNNPLHLACLSGKAPTKEVMEILFETFRGALAETNSHGWTPLHCACATRVDAEVIRSLVKAFPLSLALKDQGGRLPLHVACSFFPCYETAIRSDIVRILLEDNPSAAKEKDEQQQTPLHCACWWSPPIQVIQYLVESYPQAMKENDCNLLRPLEVVDSLIAARQQNTSQTMAGIEVAENRNETDVEISQLLAHLQSALDPDIPTNKITEFLVGFGDAGWRGGVGLVLDAHSSKLCHLNLKDWFMPELMTLVGRWCKLTTMSEVIKGVPELFEGLYPT